MRSVKLFLLWIGCWQCMSVTAQEKPAIDASVYGTWPTIQFPAISNDGKYAKYVIDNRPLGSKTLVIQSTDAKWKMELPGLSNVSFSPNSRLAVFPRSNDSLAVLTLDTHTVEYIPAVSSFQLPEKGNWWVHHLNSAGKVLVARNLKTGKERRYQQVNRYWLSNNGGTLVLQIPSLNNNSLQQLIYITLESGEKRTIWEGTEIGSVIFGDQDRLAFVGEQNQKSMTLRSIWYFKPELEKALSVVPELVESAGRKFNIETVNQFNNSGDRLFITLRENKPFLPPTRPKPGAAKLTVWSYNDTVLQSSQRLGKGSIAMFGQIKKQYLAAIDLEKKTVIRLEQEPGEISFSYGYYFLTRKIRPDGDDFEDYWNSAVRQPLSLISARDGNRINIDQWRNNMATPSPEGNYLLYFDDAQKNFYTWEIATGIAHNITGNIHTSWIRPNENSMNAFPDAPAGWLEKDKAIILYDANDIWKVDPTGKLPPINLTNGYGRKQGIVFRLAMKMNVKGQVYSVMPDNGKLLLNAFNRETKENGFYSIQLNSRADPERLTMGPYIYQVLEQNPDGIEPVKARNAEMYLVQRMAADEFPNWYTTRDFKTFTPLTGLHPEKAVNWMTTELHTWKDKNGKTVQGVLYKPENFDSTRKYPVIFHYYTEWSAKVHAYIEPDYSNGKLNIPWYVSNGYLVFSPDIRSGIGEPGESALNVVVSAATYLSTKPYVNSKKMGLQGHSYGGFETDYIITHSNLFAAACSASGVADVVSYYGELWGSGVSRQTFIEGYGMKMGGTLWEKPELYINNSPLYRANHVTTPLLMFHNTIDGAVPFSQAIEFYQAMRRLGKKAWLLEYEEGNHYVEGRSAEDFSIRMSQFFDHYLKDKPAPRWMTRGIPATLRGIDDGLDIDKEIKTPGKGLVIDNDK